MRIIDESDYAKQVKAVELFDKNTLLFINPLTIETISIAEDYLGPIKGRWAIHINYNNKTPARSYIFDFEHEAREVFDSIKRKYE